MNKLTLLLMGFVSCLTLPSPGAQVAQVRLYCFSLKFQRGTGPVLFNQDLTTLSSGVNGELAFFDFVGSSLYNYSYVLWNDEFGIEDPTPGEIGLFVPTSEDANGDGFPDFFDVAKDVTATSTGDYNVTGYGSGTLNASWSRAAGSRFGTCVLDFKPNAFSSLAVFTHTFELIEYKGTLTYSPGSNLVSGTLDLKQSDNETSTLSGPVQFAKVPARPFDELDVLPGGWTNEALQTLTFPTNYLDRDLERLTNYYGGIFFDDGDPNTGEEDYWLWMLSIDDVHDADGDGIPDFTDDPAAVIPPRQPLLSLARGETNLWLTVSGDVGHIHHIQETTNVASPGWQTVLSSSLTNDPQVFLLPLPPTDTRFWRALAE